MMGSFRGLSWARNSFSMGHFHIKKLWICGWHFIQFDVFYVTDQRHYSVIDSFSIFNNLDTCFFVTSLILGLFALPCFSGVVILRTISLRVSAS